MSCGNCDLCCKVFNIEPTNSPKGEYCKHCKKGCTIYDHRPDVCRGFQCGFLAGNWRKELRPDKCGVMIQHTKEGNLKALRIQDDIDPIIFEQIKFIEKNYNLTIEGVDAR